MFKILSLKQRTQSVFVIFYNSCPQTQEEMLTFYTESRLDNLDKGLFSFSLNVRA